MGLCSKKLHLLEGYNLLLEYDKAKNQINKRCRTCKNSYESRRKRFKRAYPNQPFDPKWREPRYKTCKKGTHLMTPDNTRIVGTRGDKRCNNCYKRYRRRYQRKWQLQRMYK